MLDYYKTLHVSENASQEDIKKSYRKLAMKWHPDRNKGDKKAEEKFKEVQTAYDTLSDPQKRREYDMGGQFAYSNRSREPHFTDANDFFKSHFSSIFEDNFSDFFRQQSFVHSLELNIGFWEAINGTSKAFQIGIQNGDKIKTSDVKIEIPKGANTGDTFLVEIEGQKIQIILDVSRDEKFERHNLDLYLNIYLPFTTAILGDKMIFPHWDGDIEISLPGNLQNGQKILISNKGVTKGVFKGDLYLIVNIIIPNNITSKQKEILEQFRKTETQSNIFSNIKDYLKKQFKF